MNEIAVGIDLGTTNSTISTCWPEGQPRLIHDEDGFAVIPSVVSFTQDGEVIVGMKAKQRMLTDMENTFYSIKRFIGRDMRQFEVASAAAQYPFKLICGPNGIPLAVTGDKKIPVYQVSGMVLQYLKEMAERTTGQKVGKAVITVPANFNESQRKATKQAGEYAGLEVMRIFNEPTAAALAYGLGKTEKQIVAIYDFGGGTFDITILRLEDPVFEVLSTCGDTMLGGDDIDRAILQDMLAQFQQQYGFLPQEDSLLIQRFLFGAERMKCQLSDWIVTAFEDHDINGPGGEPLKPFRYEINREKFKKLVFELGQRSLGICNEALRLAGLKPSDIDQIVLVGGTTRIPFLRKLVEEFFGRPPLDRIQPDVVVSIGAAIHAYSLAGGGMVYPATKRDLLPAIGYKGQVAASKEAVPEFEGYLNLSAGLPEEEETLALKLPLERESSAGSEEGQPLLASGPSEDIEAEVTVAHASIKSPPNPSQQERVPPRGDGGLVAPTMPMWKATVEKVSGKPVVSLLDALKKKPAVATTTNIPASKSLADAGVAGTATANTNVGKEEEPEEVELVEEVEEIQDTKVVNQKNEMFFRPEKEAAAPANLPTEGAAPFGPVTVESLTQPYIPGDVLRQMEEVYRKETREESSGELISLGPSGESAARTAEKPRAARPPLLLDVTPATLAVATAGGFVEVIIKKNSPVPIERSHIFTTSADFQEKVTVRVLEGESNRADENTELGVIELTDIRQAPRGEVKIEVTFDISVDGILEISAKNIETGKAQKAKLTLFGT